ncbi:protein LATERAL BRANCHING OXIDOREDUCTASE 1-like [Bidens hawaiensis]|uniref:protein LATERAL BRANCHING OXIDOREDUCTASE 1-like n=1 Tax=Bidens hawaiensis TaxID=980011 RepID=UPI0040490CF2
MAILPMVTRLIRRPSATMTALKRMFEGRGTAPANTHQKLTHKREIIVTREVRACFKGFTASELETLVPSAQEQVKNDVNRGHSTVDYKTVKQKDDHTVTVDREEETKVVNEEQAGGVHVTGYAKVATIVVKCDNVIISCLQLIGHEVCDESVKSMHSKIQEFFDLSSEEKKVYAQQPGSLEGYGQAFVISEDQKLEWCDMIFLKAIPTHARKLKFWPHHFREELDTYSNHMKNIAVSIIGFIAMALGLDANRFRESFEVGSYDVRMNCYPPCPGPKKVIGISSHADISAISLLTDCGCIPGLQVLKEDQWVFVQPMTNGVVVNIGIIMEVVSNGIYKAPYHRALVNNKKDRFSVVTFCYPGKEFEVKPDEQLINSDSVALYKSFTYDGYMQSFYDRDKLSDDGVPFVDTLKI